MHRPTHKSVTDQPCACGYLERNAKDPTSPVKFDAELNEYNIEGPFPPESTLTLHLYHCPMCGGVASESKRHELFAVVSEAEAERLLLSVRELKTLKDVERVLGPADETYSFDQLPKSWPKERIERDGKEFEAVQTLTFKGLSDVADLLFSVFANGEVHAWVGPKYIASAPNAA